MSIRRHTSISAINAKYLLFWYEATNLVLLLLLTLHQVVLQECIILLTASTQTRAISDTFLNKILVMIAITSNLNCVLSR